MENARPLDYTLAVVRRPAASAINGQTTAGLGPADFPTLLGQYENYVATVRAMGIEVLELDALEYFPDAYFVEDAAIVTSEVAVMTRPGAVSRQQEPDYMRATLTRFRQVREIAAPATLDGGDVLIVDQHCIVGLSERTNREGAEQLCSILSEQGYRGDIVSVPEALHFKSSVNFLDNRTLLVTPTCAALECIADYHHIVVPEGEEYAANVVWFNGTVLVAEGFPGTLQRIHTHGFHTQVMPVSEIEKMDGGLTCLSLRLN